MKNVDIKKILDLFAKIVDELEINLKNDLVWSTIANELLKRKDEEFQISFWEELETFFLNKEKEIGICHKGEIYWRISTIYLLNGNISKSLEMLDKSREEDIRLNPDRFTASIGLSSILRPLLYRYKDKDRLFKFDKNINDYYNSLSDIEKRKFASQLFTAHDFTAQGVRVIKDDFFHFIVDLNKRKIVFNTYVEVREIVVRGNLPTYLSCIFSIGSVLEAMLDDLFTRNDEKIWKIFHNHTKLQKEIEPNSKMKSEKYSDGMTLNQKITALRLMAKYNLNPLPKEEILIMIIIGEYRDLIHPRRRLDFQFETNHYVASFLFTIISLIAGSWWPENVEKFLKSTSLSR